MRAFADDTAMTLHDPEGSLPWVEQTFTEYSKISGLDLNLLKTIFIPLSLDDPLVYRAMLARVNGTWARIPIRSVGTYLGMEDGPGGAGASWRKPLAKYLARAEQWGALGLGPHLATRAHNCYTLPV